MRIRGVYDQDMHNCAITASTVLPMEIRPRVGDYDWVQIPWHHGGNNVLATLSSRCDMIRPAIHRASQHTGWLYTEHIRQVRQNDWFWEWNDYGGRPTKWIWNHVSKGRYWLLVGVA